MLGKLNAWLKIINCMLHGNKWSEGGEIVSLPCALTAYWESIDHRNVKIKQKLTLLLNI